MSLNPRQRKILTIVLVTVMLAFAATCAVGAGTLARTNNKSVAPNGEFAAEFGIDMSNLQAWTNSSALPVLNDYTPDENIEDGHIAPGVGGTSFFKLTNTNYFPVKVSLRISENGKLHLPMRYRLRQCTDSGRIIGEICSWQYSTVRENAAILSSSGIELAEGDTTMIVALEWQWLYESYACTYPFSTYQIGDIISGADYNSLPNETKQFFVANDEIDTAGGMLNDEYTILLSVIAEQTL